MKKSLALTLAPIALLLAACGGTEAPAATVTPAPSVASVEPTESQAPKLLPAGEFFVTMPEGQEIKFGLPVPASDPRVADIEAYRKDVGARPISYIVADLDNRKGTSHLKMYGVNVFDEDGNKYEFISADTFINEWKPSSTEESDYVLPDGSKISEDEGRELYNRGIELVSKYMPRIDLSERGPQFLVSASTDVPKEFTRVSVNPDTGAGDVGNAYPVGWDIPAPDTDGASENMMTFDECMDQYAQITAEQNNMTMDEVMKDPARIEYCEATTTAESVSQ